MFRHSRYPVHKAIASRQSLEELTKLRSHIEQTAMTVDFDNMTTLQLACREGNTQVVLWILNYSLDAINHVKPLVEGYEKTIQQSYKSPLYLALENNHRHIANILFLCGVDVGTTLQQAKEFKDVSIVEKLTRLDFSEATQSAMVYWCLSQDQARINFDFLKIILQWENNSPHISIDQIENKWVPDDYRQKVNYLQFSLQQLLSADQIQTLVKLCDLSENDAKYSQIRFLDLSDRVSEFSDEFKKLSHHEQDNYLKFSEVVATDLTYIQKRAYLHAANAESKRLKSLSIDETDFMAVLEFASAQRNFIALSQLAEVFSVNTIARLAEQNHHEHLLDFCRVNSLTAPAQIAKSISLPSIPHAVARNKIAPYLEWKEFVLLSTCHRSMLDWTINYFDLASREVIIGHQIDAINSFLELIENARKGRNSVAVNRLQYMKKVCIGMTSVLGVAASFLTWEQVAKAKVLRDLDHYRTLDDKASCGSAVLFGMDCDNPDYPRNYPDECISLCDELELHSILELIEIMLMVFIGVSNITLYCGYFAARNDLALKNSEYLASPFQNLNLEARNSFNQLVDMRVLSSRSFFNSSIEKVVEEVKEKKQRLMR